MALGPVYALLFLGVVLTGLPGLVPAATTTLDDDGPTGSAYSGTVSDGGPTTDTTATSETDGPDPLCDSEGYSADYLEAFSGSGSTMVRHAGSRTGCPNHVNWPLNGYYAREFWTNATIPAYPVLFADGMTTDLSTVEGQVGILLNGVSQFSAYSTTSGSSVEGFEFMVEQGLIDPCGGSSTEEGRYHHYSTPGCLQEQAMAAAGTTSSEHSPQLGWAYDGFPIYGQLGPGGVEMLACEEPGADDTFCLDDCMGFEGALDVDGFLYRYYTSCGTDEAFYPLTLGCYRGCCPEGLTCTSPVEHCGDSSEDGTTASYTPTKAFDLSEVYDAELIEGNDSDYINSTFSLDCRLYLGNGTVTVEASGTSRLAPPNLVIAAAAVLVGRLAVLRAV